MQIYKQSIDEIEQQLLSMSQNTQHNPQGFYHFISFTLNH